MIGPDEHWDIRMPLGAIDPFLSPFHAAMLGVMGSIATDAGDTWDEDLPSVWCVDRHPTALGDPRLMAWEMPIPPQLWADRDGVDVVRTLARLARSIRATLRKRASHHLDPAGRYLCGIAMCAESWLLDIPDDATEAQRDDAQRFVHQPGRGIADHPWGTEVKAVFGVSSDGWRYHVARRRTTGDGPVYARPRDGGITGRYIEALDVLLDGLLIADPNRAPR